MSDGEHECPTCGRRFEDDRAMMAHHQNHDKTYYQAYIQQEFGVSSEQFIKTQYCSLERSVPEIAEMLGASNNVVQRLMDNHGVETRSQKNGEWVDCENCGEQKWEPQSRLGRAENFFCDMSCRREWEGAQYFEVDCSWCGESKEVHKSEIGDSDQFFCDHTCQGKWISANWMGENHPNWTRQEVSCAQCGVEKVVPQCIAEQPNHFCDGECRALWVSENFSGEDSPHWVENVVVACEWCGGEISLRPSEAESHTNHFCDRACKGAYHSEQRSGEGHPNWAGGHERYYGPNWHQQREKVLERDDQRCQDCGMSAEAHLEEYDEELHIHHITPLRDFTKGGSVDYEKANSLDNLATLCRDCHFTWEQMAPLRPETSNSTAD